MQPKWTYIGSEYKSAETFTRPFADLLIQKSGLATHTGPLSILDLGCGTGVVPASIYETSIPKEKWGSVHLLAGDISESMLEYLKARAEEGGWPGLETRVVDATVCFSSRLPPPLRIDFDGFRY
jgi:SAM-dependent methyltransferase